MPWEKKGGTGSVERKLGGSEGVFPKRSRERNMELKVEFSRKGREKMRGRGGGLGGMFPKKGRER